MASFTSQVPTDWAQDPEKSEFMRDLVLFLDEMTREEGIIATGEATTVIVLTQQQKLDLMTITQAVNLDTVESQAQAATDALASLLDSLPDYTISNDGTVRTLNADSGDITISNPPTQAEVQGLVTAFNILSDFVATMNRDIQNKDVFG